jgi:hypothetical protein
MSMPLGPPTPGEVKTIFQSQFHYVHAMSNVKERTSARCFVLPEPASATTSWGCTTSSSATITRLVYKGNTNGATLFDFVIDEI